MVMMYLYLALNVKCKKDTALLKLQVPNFLGKRESFDSGGNDVSCNNDCEL